MLQQNDYFLLKENAIRLAHLEKRAHLEMQLRQHKFFAEAWRWHIARALLKLSYRLDPAVSRL